MKRIAAAALSLALIAGGSVGVMAQTSGSSTPASQPANHKETAAEAHWRHHNDPAGDRYTTALNTLGADGYSGVSNLAENGKDFTAMATSPQNQQVSVSVDPASNTVTPNAQ